MSKLVILGDTHIGARSDSLHFHKYFEKFYSESFIPFLLENNITTVIQLGDLFDRRKYINFLSLTESRRYLFDVLKENNINLITLLGNHDLYWKESLTVSSTNLLLKDYDNILIIDTPQEIKIDNISLCIIPWICKENYQECIDIINSSKSHVCFGHFEISGFSMYRGVESHGGLDSSIFDKFDSTFSGHYHHRSTKGNITYVGTPYEMTWQDYNDPRGFHVYDLETRKLTFIENEFNMFHKISYDDTLITEQNNGYTDPNILKNFREKYVKVVVKNKTNPYLFDTFISALYSVNPIDVTIIEDIYEILEEDFESIDEAEDTLTILGKYIDNVKTADIDSSRLKSIMRGLYEQATSLETA